MIFTFRFSVINFYSSTCVNPNWDVNLCSGEPFIQLCRVSIAHDVSTRSGVVSSVGLIRLCLEWRSHFVSRPFLTAKWLQAERQFCIHLLFDVVHEASQWFQRLERYRLFRVPKNLGCPLRGRNNNGFFEAAELLFEAADASSECNQPIEFLSKAPIGLFLHSL